MVIAGVVDVVDVVGQLDRDDCSLLSREQVQRALGKLARVQCWHDGMQARLTRRLGDLAETNGAILPAADIAAWGRGTRKDAEQTVRRASLLSDVPEMEQALNAGEVSAAHIDALGRAVRGSHPSARPGSPGRGTGWR